MEAHRRSLIFFADALGKAFHKVGELYKGAIRQVKTRRMSIGKAGNKSGTKARIYIGDHTSIASLEDRLADLAEKAEADEYTHPWSWNDLAKIGDGFRTFPVMSLKDLKSAHTDYCPQATIPEFRRQLLEHLLLVSIEHGTTIFSSFPYLLWKALPQVSFGVP